MNRKPHPPKPPPPPLTAKRDLGTIRICTNCAANSGDITWAGWVIYHEWETARIATLKATGSKVLAYRNASFASPSGGLHVSDMVDAWYAKSSGANITSTYYADQWFADVGHTGYQQAWASAVIARLSAGGWSGVMMDDVNQDQDGHLNGRVLDLYPTRPEWLVAMTSFIDNVGAQIKAAGYLVIPNIYIRDYWVEAKKQKFVDWATTCSGAHFENWSKFSTPSSWFGEPDFGDKLSLMVRTQQASRPFIATTYASIGDTRSQLYSRGAFLIAYDPAQDSALIFEPNDPEAQPPWTATWTKDLGAPTGPYVLTSGVYTRPYVGGTVTVDTVAKTATL